MISIVFVIAKQFHDVAFYFFAPEKETKNSSGYSKIDAFVLLINKWVRQNVKGANSALMSKLLFLRLAGVKYETEGLWLGVLAQWIDMSQDSQLTIIVF